jgi:hypothetical protein
MGIHHRGALDLSRFDAALVPDDDSGIAMIDLTRLTFIDAYGLVGQAHRATVFPRRPRQRPARAFVWDRLVGRADNKVVTQLYEATGELGLNVVEHAGSPAGGFVAAQRYQRGQPGERAIVAVGDVGARHPRVTPRAARADDRWRGHRLGDSARRVPLLDPGRGQGLASVVDCSALQASAPSFVDELIKAVLVERLAARLVMQSAPDRTVELARRAAGNHGVAERLQIRK